MIAYLRQNFRDLPDLETILKASHIQQCLALPRVRDIEWNTERIARSPFKGRFPRDVSSLIIQVTGEYAGSPCERCAKGKGPYKGCVVISPDAPAELQRVVRSW